MQTPQAEAPRHPVELSRIAQDLQIRKVQVEAVVQLLDEGNTVPFITRYRKERTGGLNEEVIRTIGARVASLRHLAERKQTVLKSIENQGKLTDELRAAILAAETPKRLEDLYLPYKPKKRSLATTARERGLEPLALAIWNRDPAVANLAELLPTLVNPEKELNSPEDVLTGVQHILAEMVAETADVRAIVRIILWESGQLVTTRSEKVAEGQGLDFKDYFQFSEPVKHIPPHRILAINRGEKENVLQVKLEWDFEAVPRHAREKLPLLEGHPHREFLDKVVDDALARLVQPSIEREIRRELTGHAEDHAVSVFARNLRSLLLAPPLRGRCVLAVDPGFRTGCKLAVLDAGGNLLEEGVVYPHKPQGKRDEAKARLEVLCRKHQVQVIAIGNGTACRETEEVVSEVIADLDQKRGQAGMMTMVSSETPSAPPQPSVSASPAPEPTLVSHIADATASIESSGPLFVEMATPTSSAEMNLSVMDASTAHGGEAVVPMVTESAAPEGHAANESVQTPVVAAPPPPAAAPVPQEPLPDALSELAYVIVNEAGASVYSASPVGREEFPNYDATLRGTISIGRRLQDPLSELVKIDPQNIGVGLYQHDVNPKELKESLEGVIESCVNTVGVDLNSASVPLLRHVAGMNQLVARSVVDYRAQNGPFRSREQLLQVPNIGENRYVQAAGFLKIGNGDNPLDVTWIHPESYPAARQLLADLGYGPEALTERHQAEALQERLKGVSPEEVAARLQIGVPTLRDILEALARPGRDPRDDLPPPIFKKGILKLEDLQPGMELKGTVLNVVDFGAFIDIGLKDSGLVHISQMANRYIKNPYEVVSVGDVVSVWVLTVDQERRRVSLTMIAPGTERKPPERRPPPPRREGDDRRPPPRGRRPAPQGQGQSQGPGRGRMPPPHQAPPPAQLAVVSAGESPVATAVASAPSAPVSPRPPLPPRKPPRERPKPKLSQEALQGKAPLRTFSELLAFHQAQARKTEEPQTVSASAPAGTPEPGTEPPAS